MMAKLLFVIEIKYSHAGIDCGVVRQTSFLLKVPRFVGDADLTRNQLVRASHQHRDVTGSNPVEVLTFSSFSTQLLKLRP